MFVTAGSVVVTTSRGPVDVNIASYSIVLAARCARGLTAARKVLVKKSEQQESDENRTHVRAF